MDFFCRVPFLGLIFWVTFCSNRNTLTFDSNSYKKINLSGVKTIVIVAVTSSCRPVTASGGGSHRVLKAREGGEYERGIIPPLVRGVWGASPEKILEF